MLKRSCSVNRIIDRWCFLTVALAAL